MWARHFRRVRRTSGADRPCSAVRTAGRCGNAVESGWRFGCTLDDGSSRTSGPSWHAAARGSRPPSFATWTSDSWPRRRLNSLITPAAVIAIGGGCERSWAGPGATVGATAIIIRTDLGGPRCLAGPTPAGLSKGKRRQDRRRRRLGDGPRSGDHVGVSPNRPVSRWWPSYAGPLGYHRPEPEPRSA